MDIWDLSRTPGTPHSSAIHNVPPPPSIHLNTSNNDSTWLEVHNILDVWKIGHHFKYFIDWKGRPIDERSWVPLSDLSTGLNELIIHFHQHHKSKPKPHDLDITPIKPWNIIDNSIPPSPIPSTPTISSSTNVAPGYVPLPSRTILP
ncbi:hypothetical protein BOTBODRAFT_172650 [Botryobasidium botryosum FD-172 SS1]|uniref:Chromo domain-containing protein n=1 Tax=Botryobasidium botryosum (strain FD-172 SS1) TaxID=930990 RepID=A0A067MQR9_BOTB1|nr:hypothetical protein BOTBODRAFT_172650 [Botryobasidium botryosum FD-172 SS1]